MSTDSEHGDAGLSIDEFMPEALDDIIYTLLRYGEWPQPPAKRSMPTLPRAFDLYDFLLERIDPSDLLEYYILSLDERKFYNRFDGEQAKARKRVKALLEAHLAGSEIVAAQAEKLAQEAAE